MHRSHRSILACLWMIKNIESLSLSHISPTKKTIIKTIYHESIGKINSLRVLPMDCIIQFFLQETKVWVLHQIPTSAFDYIQQEYGTIIGRKVLIYSTELADAHGALSEVHCLFCSHVFENKIIPIFSWYQILYCVWNFECRYRKKKKKQLFFI